MTEDFQLIFTLPRVTVSQKSFAPPTRALSEKLALDIRRATRKHHSVAPTCAPFMNTIRRAGCTADN
ncbi:MAG: hypothetical protein ACK5YF_06625, partial [Rhodobacterales bacterium]